MDKDPEATFKQKMISAGWDAYWDVFGVLYAWGKTNRHVSHKQAFHYWQLTGNLPVDRLDIGDRQYIIQVNPDLEFDEVRLIVRGEVIRFKRMEPGDEN